VVDVQVAAADAGGTNKHDGPPIVRKIRIRNFGNLYGIRPAVDEGSHVVDLLKATAGQLSGSKGQLGKSERPSS
jgi:hypothetical protein